MMQIYVKDGTGFTYTEDTHIWCRSMKSLYWGTQASQFEFHGFKSGKLDHRSEVRAVRFVSDD